MEKPTVKENQYWIRLCQVKCGTKYEEQYHAQCPNRTQLMNTAVGIYMYVGTIIN